MYSSIAKEYYISQRQSANFKKPNNGLLNLTFYSVQFFIEAPKWSFCVFYKQVLLLLLFRCIIQLKN